MKILHTADIHLGELTGPIVNGENARMLDTLKCMNYLTKKALSEDVDIILIAGDLFHRSRLWADEMLKEITLASNWLRELCSIAPVVLMWGTGNHDNLSAFENIKKMDIPNLTIITEPDLLTISTDSGLIQIAGVPGVDKGYFRTLFPGMDMEDENKAISEALGNVILGLGADANPSIPLVLMSHYTVTGCQLENGETVFLNSDIVIPTASLAASNYDLVCLGHIHKAQSIPNCLRPVYYSGPVNAITFSEERQDKGFWIHCLDRDFGGKSIHVPKFVKTPSREFTTLEMNELDIDYFIRHGLIAIEEGQEVENKIARVIYSCSDEINKRLSRKSLENALYNAGAFYVHEIRPAKILATVDKNAMSENDSVESNLKLWLEKQEIKSEDAIEIVDIAKPMIAQISASMPTGKLSGAFEPLRLEVKNYRSYLEEEFDFTKVSFATVNGPNGIGKSSFFMDAIADCLYEEPREGELTGWISNGEEIKSGAMTFEFLMGTDKWRVVRTRAKSGKTTLALQKWKEDKWEDYSGDKKDQTQEKILNLLGMDALTFKSCALIMQDNYGVFLEADKSDRMQVLGNILGLGIYDKLIDLAKAELKIQNKKVENLKTEIAAFDEKLTLKATYKEELEENNQEKAIVLEALVKAESELKLLKDELDKAKEAQNRLSNSKEKLSSIEKEISVKRTEQEGLIQEKANAQKIVDMEETILSKITEYESTKNKITQLKARQELFNGKETELKTVDSEYIGNKKILFSLDIKIDELEVELKDKASLEIETTMLNDKELLLEEMEKNRNLYNDLRDKQNKTEQELTKAINKQKSEENEIKAQILSCQGKVDLIADSKCPIDNPSCNFLKDALEAKNSLPELNARLNNVDRSEVMRLSKELADLTREHLEIKYDSFAHGDLKAEVQILRAKKEKLISLSGKDETLRNLLEQQAELVKKQESLKERIAALQSECVNLKNEINGLAILEAKMPSLEHWYKGKDELPRAKQIIESSNARLDCLGKELSDKEKEVIEINSLINVTNNDLRGINVTDIDLSQKEEQIKKIENELHNISVNISVNNLKIAELDSIDTKRNLAAESLLINSSIASNLNILTKAFSIDGIPFQIVRSVVSELSAQSNEILSQMTGGKMAIEMKTERVLKNKNEVNALEIWISDYQRGTMPYLSRSGGQKVKAALSVAFALADLKANRAGIQLGMMFIDEPPFLDKEGVQAYCDALELMHTRYPGMRVVAISHDPAMKARFPQEIEVVDAGQRGSKILFS